MQLQREVARGIHRIEDAHTNWYLVEDDGRVCVVDAGVPSSWDSLQEALKEIGRGPEDVDALVLTHAHFDHVGFAEKARKELDVPVYVHENDVPDRKSTRLNSSHMSISYAVFCLKNKVSSHG